MDTDAAAVVALTYAGGVLPLLLSRREASSRYLVVAGLHATVVLLLLWTGRSDRRGAAAARAWLPLLAIPLLYAELPYLIAAVGAPYGDVSVQRWERAIWGGQPARTLAGRAPFTVLSEALHLSYLSYYALIYAPLAWLWWCSRSAVREGSAPGAATGPARRAFAEAALAVVGSFVVCFVAFIAFPVQGPRFLWLPPADIPSAPVRSLVLTILERGSSRGAAFPSSHMAVALVQTLMAFRWRLPGRWSVAAVTAGLGVGAVYAGFHYAIDMVAGALVGTAVFVAVRSRAPDGLSPRE